jgi:hypothetical protein
MNEHFGFEPDRGRAGQINRRMHVELGKSLRHVCEQSVGAIPFDQASLQALIARIEGGERQKPLTFSLYYDLVDAIFDENFAAAEAAFAELALAEPASPELLIAGLGEPALAEQSDRYQRFMNADQTLDIGFSRPTLEVAHAFRARFMTGMALLDRAIPSLASEVREIVNEVVSVVGDPCRAYQFDGGSHYQLWGALFLNADFHKTDHAMVEVIAHESAHSLLFGFCTHEPLVENEDDELFASPLRPDPRPMDGIFHATYVSARMHWAMSRLIASGEIDDDAREQAIESRLADKQNFNAGHEIIRAHARLTATGRALIDAANHYMETV